MKKVLATILTASLMAGTFVGCSSNSGKTENDTKNNENKIVFISIIVKPLYNYFIILLRRLLWKKYCFII